MKSIVGAIREKALVAAYLFRVEGFDLSLVVVEMDSFYPHRVQMRTQSYTQYHSKRGVTERPRCEAHTCVNNSSENGQLNSEFATEHMPKRFQVRALQQNIVIPFLTLR